METWQPRKEFFNTGQKENTNANGPIPQDIIKWLAKLNLLYGVPFQYIVPDERMLPQESIRFFHFDKNWISAAVDGAMSIGRIITKDTIHDEYQVGKVSKAVDKEIPTVRKVLLNKPVDSTVYSGIRTGFLLRSAIVEGWPGLEVRAYATKGEVDIRTMLRMERLSKDVLLCIFDGEFEEVELREPAETMHFGADLNGKFTKMLRGLGVKTDLGVDMPNVVTDIQFKENDARTVDVLKTVNKMKTALSANGELGEYFSSAEFAVEMVESAQMGVFDNE